MTDLFNDISFAKPLFLYLLLLVPLMVFWYLRYSSRHSAPVTVSTIRSFTRSSLKTSFRHLPFILRCVSVIALVLALARPQKRNDEQLVGGEGIDIMLSIDVSGSMLSRDFQPNRLQVAKEMAAEFIRNRPVDRIGLVIFSGESYTLSPLTNDRNILLEQVSSLQSGLLPDGTLIGEGLAMAVDRLQVARSQSRVVILLTDGRERRTRQTLIDPLTALEIAKSRNVKVYTIGMAREGYEALKENTGVEELPFTQAIDEALLTRIARETGGEFFRARDRKGLEETYQAIDRMEKVKVEQTALKRTVDKFQLLIIIAIAALFFDILLRLTWLRKFP